MSLRRRCMRGIIFGTSGLANNITEVFEILRKAVSVTSLFLSYMEPFSPVARGKIGKGDTGKTLGCYRHCSGTRDPL